VGTGQTPVWVGPSDGQVGRDLRSDDTGLIFGDEPGVPPRPRCFFLPALLVAKRATMKADFGDRKGGGQPEGREWLRWPRDNEQVRGDDFFSKL
jgi:hypothetical protein